MGFIMVDVLNSNQLLEDFRRLNQLKDSPYKYDSEVNKSKYEQPKKTQKLSR